MINSKTKKIHSAEVIKIEEVAKTSYLLELKPQSPITVNAGQFISIYCEGLTLRRPFSIFSNNNGNIGILFKERGKGTQYMKSLKVGDIVNLMGALGNSFKIENKKSLLIGAGVGVAPISYLKSKLTECNIQNIFISGYKNIEEIPSCVKSDYICTDDGSFGERGNVLTVCQSLIKEYQPDVIYACGPKVVLKAIAELGKKYGIETQVAMEKVMACGIGVCRGCVIDVIKDGRVQNASVCKDGPVFYGEDIVW